MMFPYSGSSLEAPLTRLLKHLVNEQGRLLTELRAYAHDNENDFVRWATQPATESTTTRNELARKLVTTMTRIRETELRLYEARRQPKYIWRLSMEEVAELYPTQIAPETTYPAVAATLTWWERWF